jgi:hypothetical protein
MRCEDASIGPLHQSETGGSAFDSDDPQSSVMEYLQKHPKSSFPDILMGLVGSSDASILSTHRGRVREAVTALAENFCIYMDGDKYCTL